MSDIFSVGDSRTGDVQTFSSAKEALREALSDPSVDVYMHSDYCAEDLVREDCPCDLLLVRKAGAL